jgi:hypothetical protein
MTASTRPHAAKPAPERPGEVSAPGPTVTLPREELQVLVHDLRNHLNSLLMNAGAVAAMCKDGGRAERFVTQLESDGEKCAQALRDLSDRYL